MTRPGARTASRVTPNRSRRLARHRELQDPVRRRPPTQAAPVRSLCACLRAPPTGGQEADLTNVASSRSAIHVSKGGALSSIIFAFANVPPPARLHVDRQFRVPIYRTARTQQVEPQEETNINTEQYASGKQIRDLREQLQQDTHILGSLDPDSVAHARLQSRIERQTIQLLELEQQQSMREQRLRQATIAQQQQSEEFSTKVGAAAFAVIGAAVLYFGWGTWWMLLGVVFALIGVVTMFAEEGEGS